MVLTQQNLQNLKCVNSYDDNSKTYYKERGFGIGITNTRQRLELVYAKKHIFEIVKENKMFSVNISINTKQL
jgi:LytS/YehU family sensor histidine kinase